MITRANKSVNKVTSLIEGLLNVSKFHQGQFSLNETEFDLVKLIDDCRNDITVPRVFTILLSGEEELKIIADAGRIEQVLTNLIGNAVKYAEESKTIRIIVKKMDTEVKVSVIDRGPGISSEKIPFLFNRYYQVETDGNRSSGLGIGLYICSEIIKKHNGKIGVDTMPGKGSTFWFTLPA
jgi:signal transduction histidine kinase